MAYANYKLHDILLFTKLCAPAGGKWMRLSITPTSCGKHGQAEKVLKVSQLDRSCLSSATGDPGCACKFSSCARCTTTAAAHWHTMMVKKLSKPVSAARAADDQCGVSKQLCSYLDAASAKYRRQCEAALEESADSTGLSSEDRKGMLFRTCPQISQSRESTYSGDCSAMRGLVRTLR